MKKVINTLLILIIASTIGWADIPRLDVIELRYMDRTWYTEMFCSGLEFQEGCVFDYKGEYQCEIEDFFTKYCNECSIFPHLIRLRKDNFDFDDYSEINHLYILSGDKIVLTKSDLKNLKFVRRIEGNMVGAFFSPTLSKADEDWINDYELEVIFEMNDRELCSMKAYAIKGNISIQRAKEIKAELNRFYNTKNDIKLRRTYKGRTDDEIYASILKDYIVVVGFCSC